MGNVSPFGSPHGFGERAIRGIKLAHVTPGILQTIADVDNNTSENKTEGSVGRVVGADIDSGECGEEGDANNSGPEKQRGQWFGQEALETR